MASSFHREDARAKFGGPSQERAKMPEVSDQIIATVFLFSKFKLIDRLAGIESNF